MKTKIAVMTAVLMTAFLCGCKNPLYIPYPTATLTPNLTETAEAALWTKTATPTITETATITHTFASTAVFVLTPSGTQVIVYCSDASGNYEIISAGEGGARPCNLTDHISSDRAPKYSPNGNKIVFISDRVHGGAVIMMDWDGRNWSYSGSPYTYPVMISWYPSSTAVIYTDSLNNSLCVVSASSINCYLDTGCAPVWSPDGTKVAVFSDPGTGNEIYVMNANLSVKTRLTTTGGSYPAWSPDSARIAYIRGTELYVMNSDGTGQAALTSGANVSGTTAPAWSPDGGRLIFYSYENNGDVCTVSVTGTNLQNLTNNSARDINPVWSRDGTRIAFASDRDGDYEIYVMNADGTNLQQWTNNTASDLSPSWK